MLRDDPQHVIEKLAVKNFDAKEIVGKVLELDENNYHPALGGRSCGAEQACQQYE